MRSAAAGGAKRITARSALIAKGYRRKADKVLAGFRDRTDSLNETNLRRRYDGSGIKNDNKTIE